MRSDNRLMLWGKRRLLFFLVLFVLVATLKGKISNYTLYYKVTPLFYPHILIIEILPFIVIVVEAPQRIINCFVMNIHISSSRGIHAKKKDKLALDFDKHLINLMMIVPARLIFWISAVTEIVRRIDS